MAIINTPTRAAIAISSVSVADAHRKAHECDPLSAYGGVIAANTEVSVRNGRVCELIFTEVIVAPGYALGPSMCWPQNIRVLVAAEPLAGGGRCDPIQRWTADTAERPTTRTVTTANWTLATGSPEAAHEKQTRLAVP